MKSFIYWTADLKSSELWSSQLWTQFKQLRIEAWKSPDFNGVWTRDLVIPVLHFTSILHGLIRTHKRPAPNVGGFIAQGLITWWVSARAEISLRPPGWNIIVITCTISVGRGAKRKFPRESLRKCENTVNAPFRPGLKFRFDYMGLFQILRPVWLEDTGLGFSARAELRPGLNPSPCNRQFGFLRICFMKFQPGLKLTM